jgi:hypothetical protein
MALKRRLLQLILLKSCRFAVLVVVLPALGRHKRVSVALWRSISIVAKLREIICKIGEVFYALESWGWGIFCWWRG